MIPRPPRTTPSLVRRHRQMCIRQSKIGYIIFVFVVMAFESNILALNGEVEAGGAGVQGRGFAVVGVDVLYVGCGCANGG
ncbi:methyl-accepting chemotaxis protein [Enterobacter hormaechei]